ERSVAGRARGIRAGDGRSLPAERLGERRSGDEARVAVANGVGARDELDVAPREAGVVEGRLGGMHSVLDEVAAPLAPTAHPDAEDFDLSPRAHLAHRAAACGGCVDERIAAPSLELRSGLHFHTRYSCSSSSNSVSTT